MGLIHDTPTHDTEQFDKVLWSYNLARTSHKIPILDLWPLSVTLTFDIRATGLIYDTPTHDTKQFDKVLWSYNNYLSRYGPDKP